MSTSRMRLSVLGAMAAVALSEPLKGNSCEVTCKPDVNTGPMPLSSGPVFFPTRKQKLKNKLCSRQVERSRKGLRK
jgi:hypothetical protein